MKKSSDTGASWHNDEKTGHPRVARLFCVLAPCVASRPRVTRWGTYYTKTYKDWMALAHKTIPLAEHMFVDPCDVTITLRCKRPQKVTLTTPRGDIDNYAKAVLDALTKLKYWTDDQLIKSLAVTKAYAEVGEEPTIEVVITT